MDLAALDAVTEAVESGAGLPEVVRAAARALDVSLSCLDRTGTVLAVAARSPAEERAMAEADALELRVADAVVGTLRVRSRGAEPPSPTVLRLVATMIAAEVERVRAPALASAEAVGAFLAALRRRELQDVAAAGAELGLDLTGGGAVVVVRAHPLVAVEDGWRGRVLAVAERGARGASPGAVAALGEGTEVVVLLPGADEARAGRAADAVLRELRASLTGHAYALGRSRATAEPAELPRAAAEALLAANVAEGDAERPALAFEETGAYRLLLSAMSEDPDELRRFFGETIEPLRAYDEQYETDLVSTVEAFLECDGNVAATAQRMFTHRHTIRYRLERVRDLSGHDVGSTDGRERLSLGLKAMRVLGITHRGGPGREPHR